MNSKYRQIEGFTLIELMVTVAVAIIVLAVGIPAYDSMMANNRAVAQANMFVTAVNLAKSEAISKNRTTIICANASATNVSAASLACSSSGGSDWANGWFVFNDEDGDQAHDSGETVKIWQALERGSNVAASVDMVRFSSMGENVGGATNFQLTQDDSTGNQTRCISVNALGQIRVERAACP